MIRRLMHWFGNEHQHQQQQQQDKKSEEEPNIYNGLTLQVKYFTDILQAAFFVQEYFLQLLCGCSLDL